MTAHPGAFGTLMEWREIYAIIDALENGDTPPEMISKYQEWRDLGARIAALSVGGSNAITDPTGEAITDDIGTPITSLQGSASRVLADSAEITWDFTVAGEVGANVV